MKNTLAIKILRGSYFLVLALIASFAPKLLGAPETGINVDHVPGPRGPVTFRDLYLRQYVVISAAAAANLRDS